MAPDFQPATSVAYATGAGHFVGPFWLRTVGPNQVITLNGHIESFNSRLRDEFLNGQLFESLLEAQVLLEDWRQQYNRERLHSSLCYLTPVEFKELWEQQHQQRLLLALDH